MLPLQDSTALVYGCGRIAPGPVQDHSGKLIISVNMAHQVHDLPNPDVSFWIDGGVFDKDPEHFCKTLCVCDSSVQPEGENVIALPARGGLLPESLNPNRLYLRPNTAVVAALWALSLGCTLVGMVGCGCETDGRNEDQIKAMRRARDEANQAYSCIHILDDCGDAVRFNRLDRVHQQRYTDIRKRIEEFYA